MSGGAGGTSGESGGAFLRAYAVVAALLALIDSVNVLTALHDAARRGEHLAAWELATWEATSGLAELVACPLIYAALRLAPPGRRSWVSVLPIHAGASLAFSALHITLMMAARIAIYGALGFHYRIEAGAALYEYRKDLLAYLVLAGVFHLFTARRPAEPAPPAPPATFDILDGSRTLRIRPHEIVAVRSAGNYAEFHLADGRRPLMRATLAELAARLEPHGLVRTHRSWLVNAAHVCGLEPAGSGDHGLELNGGLRVPLSRRYPAALERLKRSG
jgi:DNA-binding LytR/AlgR family response regulator